MLVARARCKTTSSRTLANDEDIPEAMPDTAEVTAPVCLGKAFCTAVRATMAPTAVWTGPGSSVNTLTIGPTTEVTPDMAEATPGITADSPAARSSDTSPRTGIRGLTASHSSAMELRSSGEARAAAVIAAGSGPRARDSPPMTGTEVVPMTTSAVPIPAITGA